MCGYFMAASELGYKDAEDEIASELRGKLIAQQVRLAELEQWAIDTKLKLGISNIDTGKDIILEQLLEKLAGLIEKEKE